MRHALIPLSMLCALASPAAAQSIIFKTASGEQTVALAALPQATLELADPTDSNKPKRLAGPLLQTLLDRYPAPKNADALAFRCDDGWLSIIPLSAVSGDPGSILAITEANHPLAAPRGPVFLVFPIRPKAAASGDRAARADAIAARDRMAIANNGYAWQVASIEYIHRADFTAPVERAAPGADASGGGLLIRHCVHCHMIHGAGGMVGWDLSRPPVFSYRDEARVRGYLRNPREFNPQGRMPSFAGKLDEKELDRLIAWLKALTP